MLYGGVCKGHLLSSTPSFYRGDLLLVEVIHLCFPHVAALLLVQRLQHHVLFVLCPFLALARNVVPRADGLFRGFDQHDLEHADLVANLVGHIDDDAPGRYQSAILFHPKRLCTESGRLGFVLVFLGMESELDLDARGYTECENDPGWYRHVCGAKVYVGSGANLVDLARHAERCEFR